MIQESDEFVLSWAESGSEEMTPSLLTSASCLAISSGVLGCAVGAGVAAGCSPSPVPSSAPSESSAG